MDRAGLLERVRELAATELEVDPSIITEATSFAEDLEADSLDLVQLIMALEEEFDIEIPEEELENVQTVGQALDLVEVRLA